MQLDVEQDMEMLREKVGISDQALSVLRITGTFLKKGAEADMSLHEIASIISRSSWFPL